jgi:hypothetical protein
MYSKEETKVLNKDLLIHYYSESFNEYSELNYEYDISNNLIKYTCLNKRKNDQDLWIIENDIIVTIEYDENKSITKQIKIINRDFYEWGIKYEYEYKPFENRKITSTLPYGSFWKLYISDENVQYQKTTRSQHVFLNEYSVNSIEEVTYIRKSGTKYELETKKEDLIMNVMEQTKYTAFFDNYPYAYKQHVYKKYSEGKLIMEATRLNFDNIYNYYNDTWQDLVQKNYNSEEKLKSKNEFSNFFEEAPYAPQNRKYTTYDDEGNQTVTLYINNENSSFFSWQEVSN